MALISGVNSNSNQSSSAAFISTYLVNIILATLATSGIRLCCLIKYKEIISFHEQLKSILSRVFLNSPIVDKELIAPWKNKMNKETPPVRTTPIIALCFLVYAFIAVVIHFRDIYEVFGNPFWKWFASLPLILGRLITVLYSGFLLWITQVVSLILMGFEALEHYSPHGTTINNSPEKEAEKSLKVLWDFKLLNKGISDDANGQECFVHRFLELLELIKIINSGFGLPMIGMIITLGGITCYYTFILLIIWSSALTLSLHAFFMSSAVMGFIVLICFSNFWSFCNSSQNLHEQVRDNKSFRILL